MVVRKSDVGGGPRGNLEELQHLFGLVDGEGRESVIGLVFREL